MSLLNERNADFEDINVNDINSDGLISTSDCVVTDCIREYTSLAGTTFETELIADSLATFNDTSSFNAETNINNAELKINGSSQILVGSAGGLIDYGNEVANTFTLQFAPTDSLTYDTVTNTLSFQINGPVNPEFTCDQTAFTLNSSLDLVLDKLPTLNNSATDFLVRNSGTGLIERRTSAVNPFDQDLNTTDTVEFRTITLTHNTLTNIVTSDYSTVVTGSLPKVLLAGGDGSSATNSILAWYTLANSRPHLSISGGATVTNTKMLWNAYVDATTYTTDRSSNGSFASFKIAQSGDSLIIYTDKVATDSAITWVPTLSIDDASGVTIASSLTLFSENVNVDALRDGPGGAGYISVVDGFRFQDGTTPQTLSRYTRQSGSFTWTGGTGYSVATTITSYRIGNLVMITVNTFSDTQSTSSILSTSVAIVSDHRPDALVETMCTVQNSGTEVAGFLSINSSGLFELAYYAPELGNVRTAFGGGVAGLNTAATISFVKA